MREPLIEVKLLHERQDIERLRPLWTRFNRNPQVDIDFVLLLSKTRAEIERLHILAVYKNAVPLALLVGRLEEISFRPHLGYLKLFPIRLKQVIFVRDGWLGEFDAEITNALLCTIIGNLEAWKADVFCFRNLPLDGNLCANIRVRCGLLQKDYTSESIDHWKSTLPDTFEDFLSRRPRKHRSWLRRNIRVFERDFVGRFQFAIYETQEAAAPFCAAAEVVAQKTYQRGLGAGFIDNDENRKRVALFAQKGWFKGYLLFVDNQPLAFWSGELLNDTMWLTWTGFDPQYEKYEVGTICFLKMVNDLITRRVHDLDYGLGWAHYKERFGDICLRERNIAVYAPTLRGSAVNVISLIENLLNRFGKRLLTSLRLSKELKRVWRSALASKTVVTRETEDGQR